MHLLGKKEKKHVTHVPICLTIYLMFNLYCSYCSTSISMLYSPFLTASIEILYFLLFLNIVSLLLPFDGINFTFLASFFIAYCFTPPQYSNRKENISICSLKRDCYSSISEIKCNSIFSEIFIES